MSFYTSSGGPPISEAMYNGGTQLGQNLSFGSADNYSVTLLTNATAAITVDTSQNVTVAGTLTVTGATIFTGQIEAPSGTVALPGISFASDLDCGLYRIGANNIGFACNAAKVLDIGVAGLAVTGALSATTTVVATTSVTGTTLVLSGDGAVGAPGFAFVSDLDCGLYRIGANNIAVAVAGAKVIDVLTSGVNVVGAFSASTTVSATTLVLAGAGAVSAPSLAFTADPNTGLYNIGADDIGLAVGGALSFEVKGLDVVIGNAAIATNATSGFLWLDSCAGAATGTPANTFTGRTPIVFDTTNGRLYAYYGAAWKYASVAT